MSWWVSGLQLAVGVLDECCSLLALFLDRLVGGLIGRLVGRMVGRMDGWIDG